MSLSPGTRLGPYEIVAPLGAGGMGEVYRARDTRLGRDVAVKVLPQHLTDSADNRARFEREAKTVSSLNHPNICTLFDVGREADTDYLVMELVEGETLAHRLARGPLPVDQVLSIGAQIADAISRAHRAGIVHRDLKPGNVMLTKSGAKLMDFGLARARGPGAVSDLTSSPTVAEPLTAQGTIVGTCQYMAPEQLEGREIDERSDVWALGCVLYEMATGQRAFEGKSQASLIAAILEHAPAPIAEIQPMSPPALDRLVRGCLAKDPDDRVQTAHDVKLQLQWIGAEPAGSSASAPAVVRPSRGPRFGPGLTALAVIAVVAVLAFTAGRHMAAPAGTRSRVFQQRTYRTQTIFNARFMPDGRTIVLSAALEGNRPQLFVVRPEYPEPQPLGKKDVQLLGISSRGELLVLTHARYEGHHRLFAGTLARMPLEGAAPREFMEDVRDADWAPDGETIAVIHNVGGADRLEYPVGHVLHESAGYLSDPRVSPDGSLVAFMEHPFRWDDRGSVKVVDRSGKVRELSAGYWGLEGMAWSPDGKALYYSGVNNGAIYGVYRSTLDGDVHVVSDNAGIMTLLDVAKDGTWAVTRDSWPIHLLFRAAGTDKDVDLSWLDSALMPVLSGDGKKLVFTDESNFGGPNYAIAMRPTSGGAIVRLGEGQASEISADGTSVLAIVPSTPPRIEVYPTGVGQSARLDRGQFENVSDARWLPGEKRILVSGNLVGGPARAFLLDPATHEATPVGPEGIWNCIPSPDGRTFLARTKAGWAVYPLASTGAATPVPDMTSADDVIRWNLDGSAVFVFHEGEIPAVIERIELATGKRQRVMTLSEGDRAGRVSVPGVSMADDLRTVAYAAWDYTSVLFTAAPASRSRP